MYAFSDLWYNNADKKSPPVGAGRLNCFVSLLGKWFASRLPSALWIELHRQEPFYVRSTEDQNTDSGRISQAEGDDFFSLLRFQNVSGLFLCT